jgi:hypothetical protein
MKFNRSRIGNVFAPRPESDANTIFIKKNAKILDHFFNAPGSKTAKMDGENHKCM